MQKLNVGKKVSSALLTIALVFGALVFITAEPAEAALPKLSIGRTLVTGSPLKLAMTSKYKNKRVVIEIGKLVRKKLKYTRLTSVLLNSGGSATLCTQTTMPSTSVLRVKYGSKVLATTKTKTRSSLTACPLAAPAALDLASSSDSGVSTTDNITNSSSVTLTGTAFPNSSVTLFDNGSTTGQSVTAGSSGEFSLTLSSSPSEGSHAYTVQSSIAGLTSPLSTQLVVSVDRTKPSLNWT